MIAGHAALLAWKSGRPVKIVYDRAEDMAATTKRHPSRTRHRTAVVARRPAARDGRRLRDRRRRVLHAVAGRAVARHDPRRGAVLLSRTSGCAAGRWRPTRRRTARSAASARRRASSRSSGTWTASPPPPVSRRTRFRRRNFIVTGQTSAVGQVMREPIDMGALLDRALALSDYHAKRARFAAESTRRRACARASASRRSCTALDSPARARSSSPRSSPSRHARTAACACCRRAPRSARAPTPIFAQIAADGARAAGTRRSRSRSPTRRSCRTAGRPSRRARAWWSASWSKMRSLALKTELEKAGLPAELHRRAIFAARAPTTSRAFGPLRATAQYQAAARSEVGRRDVSGRRVRHVRVGGLRRRGVGRHRRPSKRASTTSSRCRRSGA